MIIFAKQHQTNRIKCNSLKKLLLAFLILLIIPASFASATQTKDSQVDTSKEVIKQKAQENPNSTVTIFIPLIAALLGGVVGALISIIYFKNQAKKEYIALILAFCSEMVSIFWRCVMYYKQSKTGEISYSALFSFTDSSALSKFASVCRKPAVVAAIVELKSMYFQIQRHVEEASRLAIDSSQELNYEKKEDLLKKAARAQGTALVFFIDYYKDIEKEMNLLVNTTKQVTPGMVANNLYSKYSKAKADKIKIDKEII